MTKAELRERLKNENFREDEYYLDGGWPSYEGLVLSEIEGKWLVEYIERGFRSTIGEFNSEAEACEEFYKFMSKSSKSEWE
jgi:hypothetical protein